MGKFKRTKLGDQELTARALKLNARSRTLLLLLESDDLKQMNVSVLKKIASPENYQTLLDLDLITEDSSMFTHGSYVDSQPMSSKIEPKTPIPVQSLTFATVDAMATDTKKDQDNASVFTVEIGISTTTPTVNQVSQIEQKAQLQEMNFFEVKALMQHTLKQYCGLMAKGLILSIEQSNSVEEVRQYQGKWLTSLFETRISRQQLNALLNTINHNMDRIEIMSA